jgi:hypothetical protein
MTNWKLDEALLDQMAREMACEAEADAARMEKLYELIHILLPAIIDMRNVGETPKQIGRLLHHAGRMVEGEAGEDWGEELIRDLDQEGKRP